MSRYEDVLVNTDAGFDEVAATIERATGGSRDGHAQADLVIILSETARVFFGCNDYEDEPGLPLSDYRYRLVVQDLDRGDGADYTAQIAVARRVYEALAAETGWALMLLFDDLDELAASRPALARSA